MQPCLEVESLRVNFGTSDRPRHAVDGVSLSVGQGQTVALVGESGCGKSVTALSLARLLPPGVQVHGRIRVGGIDVLRAADRELQEIRGGRIAYVFQEPATSLNPVMTVGAQIAEAVRRHRRDMDPGRETVRWLERVGVRDAARRQHAYPHQFSGGMQQRVMIAMALACRPDLLVADEPTTALDVTIQAQILDLLTALQAETGMGILLITHNLGLVKGRADQVHVMYAGQVVECGPSESVIARPLHPYTRGLLACVPRLRGPRVPLRGIEGMVPALGRYPAGCRFRPRCPAAGAVCAEETPHLRECETDRGVRCHCSKSKT